MNTILVTGGAGFIGSALVRNILSETDNYVVNIDKLTYAGNLDSLGIAIQSEKYSFERIDISSKNELANIFRHHKPSAVMHLAAESHVDRSIDSPSDFMTTNIIGTFNLLETAREYFGGLSEVNKRQTYNQSRICNPLP